MPDNPYGGPGPDHIFGGGVAETLLHPAVLVGMLVAIILLWTLPRKYAMAPLLFGAFMIPLGQQIYLGGMHWQVLRIIILCGLLRVAVMKFTSRKGLLAGGFNAVDQAFLVCMLVQAACFALLYMQTQALVNQFGFLADYVGGYFLVRVLIRDEADIYLTLKCLAVITVVLAITMVREQMAQQNVFGLLGGVDPTPAIREGKIRSQGVFQHALTAGTFAATLLPLFFLLWYNGKSRVMGAAGMIGCTVMTICSNSSTPLLAYGAGLVGVCFWPIRKDMRRVRWGLVIGLVALNIVMKAPMWFIIAHIDLTGSSSGYHRAELVDQFLRHIGDWWLIGTKDAQNWGWDMWDQQNQFVNVGETGGLAALALLIAVISRSFAKIGKARKVVSGKRREWMLWFLGAALFANVVAFFGVNYFDQSRMTWFALLAMISAATAAAVPAQRAKASLEAQPEQEEAAGMETLSSQVLA
jgi:hypothetical protein